MSRNEGAKHLEERYCKFDARNLVAVAAGTIGQAGIECTFENCLAYCIFLPISAGTKLRKCVEGQYNKAYALTMSNGDELVARVPNPNAGPVFYTTASEVATRHFVISVPLPYDND